MTLQTTRISLLVGVLVLLGVSTNAQAQAPVEQTLWAECLTRETGGDGVRHRCYSGWESIEAPEGYVLGQNSLEGGVKYRRGSENSCSVEWDDFVEVLPGIEQPKTLRIRAYARGPKGHFSGTGKTNCGYTVMMVPVP